MRCEERNYKPSKSSNQILQRQWHSHILGNILYSGQQRNYTYIVILFKCSIQGNGDKLFYHCYDNNYIQGNEIIILYI